MRILIFAATSITGLLLTAFLLVYLTNRKNLTPNQLALVVSFGLFLTWLCSFFFPFLMSNSHLPSKTIMIFVMSFAGLFGLSSYIIARFYFALKQRDK